MAGDSLLLIDEMVIPTKGAHKIAMQLDMTMYSNLASEERTEKRWKELLDAAGFKIEQVYTYQDELRDSIIVATALWAAKKSLFGNQAFQSLFVIVIHFRFEQCLKISMLYSNRKHPFALKQKEIYLLDTMSVLGHQ